MTGQYKKSDESTKDNDERTTVNESPDRKKNVVKRTVSRLSIAGSKLNLSGIEQYKIRFLYICFQN